jgi:gluconolactonase
MIAPKGGIRMRIETLAYGYGLIEGPRVDAEGNLYFSDVPNGGVFRRTPEGRIETVIPGRKGVGGIALHADGGIVVSGRDICHVRDGVTRVLFGRDDIPGFNDIFTDSAGRVYAGTIRSDPFKPGERTPGELWRIDREGRATELYAGVGLSNGIGLSPDGTLLYHCDTFARHVICHERTPEGAVKGRRVFAEVALGFPDGLAVDEEGGVWVAVFGGSCVARYRPDGEFDRKIEVPAKQVTSLCFGGDDRRDLYIVTAGNDEERDRKGTIFRMRSDLAGLPVPPAAI